LLAETPRAADEEHRPADELVSDAVRQYLRDRKQGGKENLAQVLMGSPLAGANLDLERRKEYPSAGSPKKKRLSELFAALRGSDIDLRRNPSTGRPVSL
jgi:hypothetical protein